MQMIEFSEADSRWLTPLAVPSPWIAPDAGDTADLGRLKLSYWFCLLALPTLGTGALAALLMNSRRRDDVAGTWLESHLHWQIRSLGFCVSYVTLTLLTFRSGSEVAQWMALSVGLASLVWYVYRMVKGMVFLHEGKPMVESR